jgi:hypothetical protein
MEALNFDWNVGLLAVLFTVAGLAATAACASASRGAVATLFGYRAGIPAATFLRHFSLQC